MGKRPSIDDDFNALFVRRTKELRESTKRTQHQMAYLLGIPLERYKKYEKRTPLPHYLIERFALLVNVSVEYVVTGRDAARIRESA